jgi:MSHA biogenesis protein MshL
MTLRRSLLTCGILLVLAGCGAQPIATTDRHIHADTAAPSTGEIPKPVRPIPLPPPPQPQTKIERYSVVVNNVPVQELLFALARDAKVNVDVHPGIEGTVTLNAIDQTLAQILTRLSKQVDMRFELDGPNLVVMPDSPYLKNYKIDYVNIARNSAGTVGISTQVATTGSNTQAGGSGGGASGGNNSTTTVANTSNNRFWETLTQNIKDMLRETDKVFPQGSFEQQTTKSEQQSRSLIRQAAEVVVKALPSGAKTQTTATIKPPGEETGEEASASTERRFTFREAASVITNAETGVISVRATSRQHEKVREFIDQVLGSARRQVLIEATIVEVFLSDQYQAGVDWSRLVNLGDGKIRITQSFTSGNFATTPVFRLDYTNPNASAITSTIQMLSTFGDTRVLSSPKIMALNNQTALLKVVDEKVYFTTEVKITDGTQNNPPRRDFISTLHTVPIGVVMSVTPQVGDNDDISLNIRPTVSRISGFVNDPTPNLSGNFDVVNRVPEIQVRELESILRVPSGQTVVLGGLMQDNDRNQRNGVPILSRIPLVGNLFSHRNDTSSKTELVIFLRPVVVREASLNETLQEYKGLVPTNKFFRPDGSSASKEAVGKGP